MSYTYPAPAATVADDATTVQVHGFMKSPTLIARRLREMLNQRFIADFLLPGRFQAVGGAILYETGEEIFPADAPEAVEPGGEYPLTALTSGELAAARVTKWGRDTEIYDEAIARLRMNPVERALAKITNGAVRHVDSVALAVIASKVTQTYAGGAWTDDGAQIVEDALVAKSWVEENQLGEGYDLDTIVLKPTQYAKAMAYLVKAGLLPREVQNPLGTGAFPEYMGLTWTTSPHVAFTDPLLVDRKVLGGMADEDLGSPGYSKVAGVGVEVKTGRLSGGDGRDRDGYWVRARRVTVPVVLEAGAGVRITGTGI